PVRRHRGVRVPRLPGDRLAPRRPAARGRVRDDDRRAARVPLVQRPSGARVHGRSRLAGDRRRPSHGRAAERRRAAPARDRCAVRRGDPIGHHPGRLLQGDRRQAVLPPGANPPPLRAAGRARGERRVPLLARRRAVRRARPGAGRAVSPLDPAVFKGKRATLMGFARTNVALARFLVRQGAEVAITDTKPAGQLGPQIAQLADVPIRYTPGGHDERDFTDTDVVFVSPGIPRTHHPLVAAAAREGVAISSEIELLFELCPVPIAAITGSAGKTTTTILAGEMLRVSGLPTYVGGNIGTPLIDRLGDLPPDARVVLELSSFQIQPLRRSPHVGAILNVTPNHLDDPRHPTLEAYRDAKANLIAHQRLDDVAVLGLDDPIASSLGTRGNGRKMFFSIESPVVEGACMAGDELYVALGDLEAPICRRGDVKLR